MKPTVEVLREARSRVDTFDKWWHRDHSPSGSTCAVLALDDASDADGRDWRAHEVLAAVIGYEGEDPWLAVTDWNDAEDRTHSEVLAAFDRAIASVAA